uniref:ATP synthase F0 subunit 8 n=1 Tax=Cunedda sp. 1 SJ-2023a TaxID=3040701 RepID=UPI002551E405|nr:ATP synthase F0 subunit 8 [Cunedda sp. 1 SJ-2023a]WGC89446.1 ATP synthase F0 subunit 8 [Cunedda sp. 1 SJ-2023a]
MPQMSPLWWLNMMLIFILCVMIMNSLIYFNYMKMSVSFFKKKLLIYNWKW